MLVLDAGDYSIGAAFGGAAREIGGELQVMSRMGYDATTFGNHEFDYGPEGLGQSIGVAAKAGCIPAALASNTRFVKQDTALADLQRLSRDGVIREIKEWEAIMDHLRGLPVNGQGELPVVPVDERAAEVRAIKAG